MSDTIEPVTSRPLAPRAVSVLQGQLGTCRSYLEPLLARVIADAEDAWFERANRSRNNAEQQQCLASVTEIRRHKDALPERILQGLPARIETFGSAIARSGQESVTAGLELLAEQSQDEASILDDLASRAEARATMALFELGHRYAVLAASPIMETPRQPFSPAALCECLRQVIVTLDLPPEHQIEVYRLFDRVVLHKAAHLYEKLNAHLVESGILADLRSFAPRNHKVRQPKRAPQDTDAKAPDTPEREQHEQAAARPGEPPDADTAIPRADASDDPLALWEALSQQLSRRRQGKAPTAKPGRLRVAEPDAINQVLGALQKQPSTVRSAAGELQPRSMRDLRRDMLAHLRRADPEAATPQFGPQQLDTMELMTMLFDRLSQDIHSTPGNYLLSELQAPLLRIALDDQAFFTDHHHPARNWLEKVAEASARWGADAHEDDGDLDLIERVHGMNRAINRDFDGDLGVFEGMSGDLQQQLDQLARRAEVAERRAVEAARGRERLDVARRQARTLVDERLADGTAPGLTRTLLRHAWIDVLASILLRQGEDSDEFRHKLAIVDSLGKDHAGLSDPERNTLREQVELGLAQVGMEADDASLLARAATGQEDPQAEDSNEDKLTRTELAMKLKQREPFGIEEIEQIEELEPDTNLTKEHAEAAAHIKSLAFGTWFEFDDPKSGKPIRRKMSWYSTQTGRCLFVNRRGIRCLDTSIPELARSMVTGKARPLAEEDGGFIDRALKGILSSLKRITGSQHAQEQPA